MLFFFITFENRFYILMCLKNLLIWADHLFAPPLCCPCIRVSHRKQSQVSTVSRLLSPILSTRDFVNNSPRATHGDILLTNLTVALLPCSKCRNLIFQEPAAAIKFALHPFSSWNIHQTNSNSSAYHYLLLLISVGFKYKIFFCFFSVKASAFGVRVLNARNKTLVFISISFSASKELQNFKLVN